MNQIATCYTPDFGEIERLFLESSQSEVLTQFLFASELT